MKVMFAVLLCLCSFTNAICTTVAADIPPTMTLLENSYETNLQIIIKSDVTSNCLTAYSKKLDAIVEALKKAGDLDGVIAVRSEKKRLDEENSVPAESAPDVNPAVAKVRTEYQQLFARAEIEKNTKILALADNYAINLEALKKQLTQQDKIEDATLVKLEIERLRASAEVTAAQFVLADHLSKLPQPAPVPPKLATAAAPPAPAIGVKLRVENLGTDRAAGALFDAITDGILCRL